MEFRSIITSRHSVRSFEKKRVPRKIILKLIDSATKAPSACNDQPWTFYCVESKEKRDKVARLLEMLSGMINRKKSRKTKKIQTILIEFYRDLGGAQNIIFIYRTKHKTEANYVRPNDIKSISCAAENLMLEAVNQGLGTCWIGTFNSKIGEDKLQKILPIEKDQELVASIVVGYPSKGYKPLKRYKKKISEVSKFC